MIFPKLFGIILSVNRGSVAQLVEQLTLNQLVLGSSPSRPTTNTANAVFFIWQNIGIMKLHIQGEGNCSAVKLKSKQQLGFSLIETIITIMIVILILVLYQAAVNTIFLSRHSRNDETALRIASMKVEELRNSGYASVPATGNFSSPLLGELPSGSAGLVTSDFNEDAKQVIVNVSWLDQKTNTTKTVSLTAVIANTGGL